MLAKINPFVSELTIKMKLNPINCVNYLFNFKLLLESLFINQFLEKLITRHKTRGIKFCMKFKLSLSVVF